MQRFSFGKTELEDLLLVKVFCAEDERGYLLKDYSLEVFKENGIDYELKETFYTCSRKGVIRAIHFQRVIQQPKLIRLIKGKIYDVVVDLRPSSKTFGKWQGFWLTEESREELFIPKGFGHGYLVIEDAIVSYKCGERFVAEYDDGILWNDKDIGIAWPLHLVDKLVLAEKDRNLITFAQFKELYGGL